MSPELDPKLFPHRDLTQRIIGTFYEVCNELGAGFLESVYQAAFAIALEQSGLRVHTRCALPVYFRGLQIGEFVADIVVEDSVILELKAVEDFHPIHEAQLLNYLRASDIEVGLLLNFGPKPKVRRMAYSNARKRSRPEIPAETEHLPHEERG